MKGLHLAGALALTLAAAGAAQAQDTPATTPTEATPPATPPAAAATGADTAGMFGQAGQLAFEIELDSSDNASHMDLSFLHSSLSMGGGSQNLFTFAPAAHYFVVPNVSVSGALVIAHGDTPVGGQSVSATIFGILVGAGYNLHLTPMLSAWPQLQIGYAHVSGSFMNIDVTGSFVPFQISVPILFHPAEHFFLGLGPIFRTQLSNSAEVMNVSMDQAKQTDIGITAVIGGYFGM